MKFVTREQFLESEAGTHARLELQHMSNSADYDTLGMRANQRGDKENFVERHISYLVKHPDVSPAVYLANLRVMTKSKR
jgi:hypothetical protein